MVPLSNSLAMEDAQEAAPVLMAVEPGVPADPLAAAASPAQAVARHFAVAALTLDARAQGLLEALHELDELLSEPAEPGGAPLRRPMDESDGFELTAVDDTLSPPLDEAPTELEVVGTPRPPRHTPSGMTPPELPPESDPASAVDHNAPTRHPDTIAADSAPADGHPPTDTSGPTDAAEAFVRAGNQGRHQMAAAETIVLSGPDIKRKIRHKQSVMPSYISQVLYDDIGALFEIGDREGALISLERLLTIAPISPQIETFLAHNEGRLLEYYESVLGPWTRTARLRDDPSGMPGAYFGFDKMARIVSLLDGTRPLGRVLTESGLRQIEACAVLSQLARSNSLDVSQK